MTEAPETRERPWRRSAAVVVALVGVIRVLVVAALGVHDGGPDTQDYLVGFTFGGAKPPVTSFAFQLVGDNLRAITIVHALVAAVTWGYLAWIASGLMRRRSMAWTTLAVILALSLTPYVLLWETVALSESMALSAMALVVALAIKLTTSPDRAGVWVAFAAASATAVFIRAGNRPVIAALAVGLLVLAAANRPRGNRWAPAITGVVLLCAVAIGLALEAHSHQDVPVIHDNIAERILTDSDVSGPVRLGARTRWFQDHGMPVSTSMIRLVQGRGFNHVDWSQPELHAYRQWLDGRGQRTYAEFLATHPTWVASMAIHTPVFLRPGGGSTPFVPNRVFHIWGEVVAIDSQDAFLLAVLVCGALCVWRRDDRRLLVPAAALVLGFLYALTALLGDAAEIGRHLIVPNIEQRVAIILILAFCLDS